MKTVKIKPFTWADSTYSIEVNLYDEYYKENGWDFHDFKIDMSLICTAGKRAKKIYTPSYKMTTTEDRSFFLGWCINDLVQEMYRHSMDTLSKEMRQTTMRVLGEAFEKWFDKVKLEVVNA